MYKQHNSELVNVIDNEDLSVKAISLLMNGYPIRIKGKELVMIDKLYERVELNGEEDVVVSPITISEIPYIMYGLGDEEASFISESYKYNQCGNKKKLLVTKIVSVLLKDFSTLMNYRLQVPNYYDKRTLAKTDKVAPLETKLKSGSSLTFSSDTLKKKGKRIGRIDSVWEIDVPGEKNKFIWGYGIDLDGKVIEPDCRILSKHNIELDDDFNQLEY